MSDVFSICLTTCPLPPLNRIAGPFSRFRNLLIPDALPLLKSRWGVLEENLDRTQAEHLSQALTEAQLPHIVIPSDQVEKNIEAHTLASVSIQDKGFNISADKTAWQLIPWSVFSLLAVGVFREKIIHKTTVEQGPSAQEKLLKTGLLLATGLPLPLTRKKTVVTTTEETSLHYYLDFFLSAPKLRLRVNGNKLDYQFLKEKLVMSAQENFRTMLKELLRFLPAINHNESFQRMVATPARALDYQESEKSFNQECRWLLTIQNNP